MDKPVIGKLTIGALSVALMLSLNPAGAMAQEHGHGGGGHGGGGHYSGGHMGGTGGGHYGGGAHYSGGAHYGGTAYAHGGEWRGTSARSYGHSYGHAYYGGRGYYRGYGGTRYLWGGLPFYFYGGYYYGDCEWLRERADATGSAYWYDRYELCRDY